MEGKIYHITTLLKAHVAQLSEDMNVEAMESIESSLDGYISMLEAFPTDQAESQRKQLHGLVDSFVREDILVNGKPEHVTCRKGCAHCCKQVVMVTHHEGIRLYELAVEKGIVLDGARLERQAAMDDAGWTTLQGEDRNCPFLGSDNMCQVYEDRPLSCRKYYVQSDPDLCDIEKHPMDKVRVCYSPDAEVLTTAAFTAIGSVSMAQILLEELRREID